MKKTFKSLAAVAVMSAAIAPVASHAQVNGIATADTVKVIAQTKAFATSYQQIQTQYKSYADQIRTKLTELNGLNAKLDTNGDKVVNQQEMDAAVRAKNPVLNQIAAKENEIKGLNAPIEKAHIFAIEGIVKQYGTAQNNVIAAKKISIMLAPDAFVYAPDQADVSGAITAELDRIVPSVATSPTAGWQPSRQGAALYKQIQQIIALNARAQAAKAQQAGAAPQPSGR